MELIANVMVYIKFGRWIYADFSKFCKQADENPVKYLHQVPYGNVFY